jgi:UDP-N-acetylmuramate dehydrogenase
MINSTTPTNLAAFTTIGVQATANCIDSFSTWESLSLGVSNCKTKNIPYLILGSGSNMLFAENYPGTIFINEMKGIDAEESRSNLVNIEVASGENWHEFVEYCLNNNWYGLENLALIPGTIGAAPVQNIGAYGTEVSEFITKVFVYDLENEQRFWMNKAECEFGYRDSLFKRHKGRYFIEIVEFSLSTSQDYKPRYEYESLKKRLQEKAIEQPTALEVFQAVIDVRRSRLPDPKTLGNAGSFFKNPVVSQKIFSAIQQKYPSMPFYEAGNDIKIPAAWLIEQCGLKGITKGAVGIYHKQALVLVNHGGATALEVWDFAMFVVQEVEKQFGIKLVPEVNVVKNAKIMDFS